MLIFTRRLWCVQVSYTWKTSIVVCDGMLRTHPPLPASTPDMDQLADKEDGWTAGRHDVPVGAM